MGDVELGRAIRVLRMRRGWRQQDLAERASTSRTTIWRAERGRIGELTIDTVRSVARTLEMTIDLVPRWRGGDLLRVVSERHAVMTGVLLERLGPYDGWTWHPEVGCALPGGDRGSVDVVGWRAADCSMAIVEAKPELLDPQGHVAQLDRYRRAAPAIARSLGVTPATIGLILATERSSTNRDRRAAHRQIYDRALPDSGRAALAWLRRSGPAVVSASVGGAPTTGAARVAIRAILFVALPRAAREGTRHLRTRVTVPRARKRTLND